jgi:hypothetical protein
MKAFDADFFVAFAECVERPAPAMLMVPKLVEEFLGSAATPISLQT